MMSRSSGKPVAYRTGLFMSFSLVWSKYEGFSLFYVYITALQLVLVPVAAVGRLPVHHHSADYISFPLGSLGPLRYT